MKESIPTNGTVVEVIYTTRHRDSVRTLRVRGKVAHIDDTTLTLIVTEYLGDALDTVEIQRETIVGWEKLE
jgi:hypothetical protein